jgi:hypothetical protein
VAGRWKGHRGKIHAPLDEKQQYKVSLDDGWYKLHAQDVEAEVVDYLTKGQPVLVSGGKWKGQRGKIYEVLDKKFQYKVWFNGKGGWYRVAATDCVEAEERQSEDEDDYKAFYVAAFNKTEATSDIESKFYKQDAEINTSIIKWKMEVLYANAQIPNALIGQFYAQDGGDVWTMGVKLILFADLPHIYNSDGVSTELFEDFYSVATKLKGQVQAILVSSTQAQAVNYFSLQPTALPAVVMVHLMEFGAKAMQEWNLRVSCHPNCKLKTHESTDLSQSALLKFVEENINNTEVKQRPQKKSKYITEVESTTFEGIVIGKERDVLVEFYAPWCGNCKVCHFAGWCRCSIRFHTRFFANAGVRPDT